MVFAVFFFWILFSFFFEQAFAIIFYLSRLRVKQTADPFFEITFANSGGLLDLFFFSLSKLWMNYTNWTNAANRISCLFPLKPSNQIIYCQFSPVF